MKKLILIATMSVLTTGCASMLNDANTPVNLSLSSGERGRCELYNNSGTWMSDVPGSVSVRRSNDDLTYNCTSDGDKKTSGAIKSTISPAVIGNVIFGIAAPIGVLIDVSSNKHRKYPDSYVIPESE